MPNVETPNSSDLTIAVEQPKAWARRLKITVPAARVEKQRRDVTSKLAGQVRLPGFRKGKVPARVLEKQFGSSIEQQALEKVIGDAYKEALAREGFEAFYGDDGHCYLRHTGTRTVTVPRANPHRPFTPAEARRRDQLGPS